MKQPFKIVIKDGNITSVYSEKLDLARLGGVPEIHRATEVAFDNTKKCWDIYILPPVFPRKKLLASGFPLRSEAIDFEIKFLNEEMENIVGSRGLN